MTATLLTGAAPVPAAKSASKTTFTVLHTNDMHSALIGMGPSSDYTPATLNDDATRGGFARLARLIAQRKAARASLGPVLILDAGDFSMGTAFGAASRETGGELRLMHMMGYDATTLGNHDFDLGPEGLAQSMTAAAKGGGAPPILAANTQFEGADVSLAGLKRLAGEGALRRHLVIERGGVRFGVFGVIGKEATFYATGAGAVTFADANETARAVTSQLREGQKVDVVICLSHGGLVKAKDGGYHDGDDVAVARSAPGIDVVIGGHSHTELSAPIIVGGRTPVVQTGLEGRNLGELVVSIEDGKLTVESYRLYPVDDSVGADEAVTAEVAKLKKQVTAAVFASRGFDVDEPLAIATQDLPNTFPDIEASTPLANFCTDAFRAATGADIAFNVNGMTRAAIRKGKSGVQTVYDIFSVAPLGAGVVDHTAGSALVTAYFTGQELKHMLEFFLIDNPAHPGEYFPRSSGLRCRYDPTRPKMDVVTAIELGDLDRGYAPIDISGKDDRLYSVTCSLYVALVLVSIPKYTKGALALAPKNRAGQPLKSRVEALEDPRDSTPYLLPPRGEVDAQSVAAEAGGGASREIKEWQAIMDHLRRLPVKPGDKLPIIPVDDRAREVRAIRA